MVAFSDPLAIGKITTAESTFKIQRGDQTIELSEGDFIYLDDVISAGGTAVGIAFADETTMSVDPNSTMVIDDFVYDTEDPTTGSMSANIIEGNFSFVSGQIAKVGNDAMKVTTPVLTIGVRGTQVAGKANTEGEDNEIVLLPNNDGTVGQIMIANQSGEVLLTKPYEATIIANAFVPPTVPVVLPKSEVLKKFATTISTTRKTEAKAEVERDTEEAVREKEKAEEEQEELEEEKEELEEEAEALEEEKEELEENIEELEEEAEEAAEEQEEVEEEAKEVVEKKEKAEEKQEEVAEELEQLEEELADANVQERAAIEEKLEQLEEEFEEIAEEVAEIEKEIEVVEEKKKVVDKKVEEIEKEFVEAKEDFVEIEQKAEIVEQEVQQVIEQELVIEQEIKMVEQKFEAIVEKFEVFQEEFAMEFQDFIPEAEIQQFIEEAPEELVEEFKENIIEKLEEENEIIRIEKEVEEQELQEISEEDPFSEENVEEKLEEIDDNINELKETEQELNDKGKQLQNVEEELREESSELEEESREIQEKGDALNEKNRELEEREQQAIENNDREALEELQQEFDALDKEQSALYEQSQELDKEFDAVNEQYNELNEEYQELNEEYQELDQEFREFDNMATNNNFFYNDDNKELDIKTGMDEFNSQVLPEDQVLVDVDDFIAEEKAKVLENSDLAQEADNFFNNNNVLLNNDISQQVQDLMVINFQYLDEYVVGVGNDINTLDDYENNFEDDSHLEVIDANAELYQLSLESDYWFDLWVEQQVADNINVAPWLNLQGDVTKAEATAVDSLLFSFGASDANGDRLTYSIFNDPTGKLRIEGQNVYLDQSFSVTDDTTYQIILKVEDPYGASDVDHIYLTVENNHSPEISNTSDVSLAENVSVGTTVATISASDAEGENITGSITAGNDSNLFTFNEATGAITTAAALDYETTTSHTLTITATDAFGNTSTVNQVVNVTNVNEVPTISSMNAVSLAEDVSSGTSVATTSASDVDAGTTLTYSISSGNDAGHFAINSSTGAITTADSLDYETTTSYTLVVTASDGTLTTSTNQVINVTDVNETAQYTKSMDSGTLAAWGALYNQDMNINNAWADSKIAYTGTNSNYTANGGIWDNLEYIVEGFNGGGDTLHGGGDWKTYSQYEQIWNFNHNSGDLASYETQYLDYLRTGGQIVAVGEWYDSAGSHSHIEDFVDLIDSDINTNNHTSIISGIARTNNGGFTTSNELHTIDAQYNVSDWGTGGEGTETKNQNDTITREDGVAAAGAFHAEHLGSGDLVTVQTLASDNTQQGFIAEWDANDSDAQYQGTFMGWLDSNHSFQNNDMRQAYDMVEWLAEQSQGQTHGVSTDNETIPIFKSTHGFSTTDQNDDLLEVAAYHLGDNVYVGGGYDHTDWAWDDSADVPYWAFNQDMDSGNPDIEDDHYGVIGYDRDGDGDLWETTDTFDLDKIKILDDSEDYFVQAADVSGDYYFKVTPVTYANNTWTVETDNTVTVANTTGHNAYLDLSSNTDFDDINYALIETESALISEVIVSA